jgi:hypothetical protein
MNLLKLMASILNPTPLYTFQQKGQETHGPAWHRRGVSGVPAARRAKAKRRNIAKRSPK